MNVLYGSKPSPYFDTDSSGYLCPPFDSPEDLSLLNKQILTDIADCCSVVYGDNLSSLYFRGSQLTDRHYSDFDVIVVCKEGGQLNQVNMSAYLGRQLSGKYLHIQYFDCLVITEKEIQNDPYLQFVIKVLCIRAHGKPLEKQIRNFKPGKECIFLLDRLTQKMNWGRQFLQSCHPNQRLLVYNHLIKFLLRCSYELVIETEHKYTRDLLVCTSAFSKYFPQHASLAGEMLAAYDNKTVNGDNVWEAINRFAGVLFSEKDKWITNGAKSN